MIGRGTYTFVFLTYDAIYHNISVLRRMHKKKKIISRVGLMYRNAGNQSGTAEPEVERKTDIKEKNVWLHISEVQKILMFPNIHCFPNSLIKNNIYL